MAIFFDLLNIQITSFYLWKLFRCIYLLSLMLVFLKIFKLINRRIKFLKMLPGTKISCFDPLGFFAEIPITKKLRNGHSVQSFVLQLFAAKAELFRKDKLYCVWLAYEPAIVPVKADVVEVMLSGSDMYDKNWMYSFLRPVVGTGLLTSNGSKWKSRRKLLAPSLHIGILKDSMNIFNEQTCKLMKYLHKETEEVSTNIFKLISLCVLDITCETILGAKIGALDNDNEAYVMAMHSITSTIMHRMLTLWLWPDCIFRFTEASQNFNLCLKTAQDFTNSVLQQKKKEYLSQSAEVNKSKRKSLMDLLLEHHIEKKDFSEEDVREEVDTFIAAANETTANTLTWALYMIGQHKNVQLNIHEELQTIFGDDKERPVTTEDLNDLKYLDCVLKESMRLYPAVAAFSRVAGRDKNICGYTIPEGTTCFVVPYVLHRDPEVFPDPEKFDPTRFFPENSVGRHPYAYIPFSAGSRNCIGKKFAIMEMKVVLATILRHFTLESLDQRDTLVPGLEVSLKPSIPLRFQLRARNYS